MAIPEFDKPSNQRWPLLWEYGLTSSASSAARALVFACLSSAVRSWTRTSNSSRDFRKLFDASVFGHIAQGSDFALAFRRVNRAEHDVDRKLGAILTLPGQFQSGTHSPQSRFSDVVSSMCHVTLPEPGWHQHLNSVTDKLSSSVAKHRPCLIIDADNTPALIGDNYGIRSEWEKNS
jgi:hypothetical protein